MAVVKWTFSDSTTSYTFDINPNTGGSPTYEKTLTYASTSAADGTTIIYEGRDKPLALTFSGSMKEESQYNAFLTWFKKRTVVSMTDDLGRTYNLYITKLTPTRQRAFGAPWRHDWAIEATILSGDV